MQRSSHARLWSASGTVVLLVVISFSMMVTGLAAGPSGVINVKAVHAAQPATRSFVVMITSQGFDNGLLNLTVAQGDTVTITFALDASQRSDNSTDNHHIIVISGYNVQTEEVSPSHPNATVTFVADTEGQFSIYCATPECPIHYLMLSGKLNVVVPTAAQTTSSTAQTTISSSSATTSAGASSTGSSTTTSTASTGAPPPQTTVGEVHALSSRLDFGGLLEWGVLIAALAFLAGAVVTGRFVLPREE